MNSFRKMIYWLALLYFQHSPFERGKWRLLSLLSSCFGDAIYGRRGVNLHLKPVSLLERTIILGIDPNPILTTAIEVRDWQKGYFLDIGANIGYFSLLAASNGAKVIAFEPSPRELKRLYSNIRTSGFYGITVFGMALSDSEGELKLSIGCEGNPGLNTLRGGSLGERTDSVRVSRIADVLGRGILENVKLVKIDVEGFELHVLSGFESIMHHLKDAEFIVEITPSYLQSCGQTAQQIYEFFNEHGFRAKSGIQSRFQWDEIFFYESNGTAH